MSYKRLSMRKIKEILRLKFEQKLTHRAIAASLRISAGTVSRYLTQANEVGLTWPLTESQKESDIEKQLHSKKSAANKHDEARPLPDWHVVQHELQKQKGVTLRLLWEEYIAENPGGYGYSWFCHFFREFKNTLAPTMRLTHIAGEKTFIDFSGLTVPWTNRHTGEIKKAEIFVAILGASNYTFAYALESQSLPEWLNGHQKAFEFFGGVTRILVVDNLRSGVKKAHLYDPDVNPTYQAFAVHYDVAVVPTRIVAPKDKAKVEAAVKFVQSQILARFRNRTFFSVDEINEAIKPLLKALNEKPFQKMPGTRCSQFEALDKPKLKPLPQTPFELAEIKWCTVGMDSHIEYKKHYYSVPYKYLKKKVECRATQRSIECYFEGERIAHHLRKYNYGFTTLKAHLAKPHQIELEWTAERLTNWAANIGPHTKTFIQNAIEAREFPEQAYRACVGMLRLAKKFGAQRFEKAAKAGTGLHCYRYRWIENLLKNGAENIALAEPTNQPIPEHENVRGSKYFEIE